jgi:oligopeptide/dipeptide ABC transporter ATP-binding protein
MSAAQTLTPSPLLEVAGLVKHYPVRESWLGPRKMVRAVDGVSFTIGRGEVVGLVGESGSGKTTVGRAVLRLIEPTDGIVRFDGTDVTDADPATLRSLRRRMQIVFQDPFGSLNPRKRIADVIGEAFDIHGLARGAERRDRIAELLHLVGLPAEHMHRFPHEFSGGQRQRIGIARAIALEPAFIVADEPVSALDVSIQGQILNLLADLQERLGLAMLFISHDLSVIEYFSNRVIVMYLGRVMEIAPARDLYVRPRHPYSEALLSAAPVVDLRAKQKRIILKGDLPSRTDPPSGCVFRTRCPYAIADCAKVVPPLRSVGPGHGTACIREDIL